MQGQTSSYVITTLLAAPVSALLTTLADVKDDLDLETADTSNDARLTRYITEESAAIARYCNRIFSLATWQDEFRPQHGIGGEGVRAALNPLTLTHWPLAYGAVTFSGNTHLSTLVDGVTSTAGLAPGMLVFGSAIPVGASIKSVSPYSLLLSTPATLAASGVSLVAGLQVVESVAAVDTTLVPGTDYQVESGSNLSGDESIARLYRLNENGNPRTWPAAKITVTYQAGYVMPASSGCTPNLPFDLRSACLRVVIGRFRAKGRDPMLIERSQPQSLGTERYWAGSLPGQSGPYMNEIMSVLERYRVPVLA